MLASIALINETSTSVIDVREQFEETTPKMEIQICQHCDSKFEKKRRWARFCSDPCRRAYHRPTDAIDFVVQNLLSVSEAAVVFQVSNTTIRRWIRLKKIKSIRLFGRVLIYKSR